MRNGLLAMLTDVVHTPRLTAPDGENSKLGIQNPGDHTDVSVERIGSYMLGCDIHPEMKLVIQVR
jgi:plastocyanin